MNYLIKLFTHFQYLATSLEMVARDGNYKPLHKVDVEDFHG